jgi:amino acid adenylation domain-containing protein
MKQTLDADELQRWLDRQHESPAGLPENADLDGLIALGQRGLWFQSQLRSSTNTGSAFCYRLRGPLDHVRLLDAFRVAAERHAVLRTRYVYDGDEPRMAIDPPGDLDASVTDVSDLCWEDVEASVQDFVRSPFDLAHDKPLRVRLWHLDVDDHVLGFVVHHIAFDGWSLGVLHTEISELYNAAAEGRQPRLPTLTTTFEQFAARQRTSLANGLYTEAQDYWRRQLRSAPPLLDLPVDHPRPLVQSFEGGATDVRIPAALCSRLAGIGAEHGATLPMVLLAGYAAFLGRWSRQDDVVIGMPVANRGTSDLEPLIGMFVNLMPMRVHLDDNLTFSGLVSQVRRTTLDAFDHQHYPFDEMVQSQRRAEEGQWFAPVVNVALALQTADRGILELGAAKLEPVMVHERSSVFDLTLTMAPDEGGYTGYFEYNTALLESGTVARVADELVRSLDAWSHDAAARVRLPGSPSDSLVVSREGAEDLPRRALLDRLTSAPIQTVAATDAEGLRVSTYGELVRDVRSLAGRLRRAGVHPGQRVGVLLDRGIDSLTAFLAVLWTGAVYVPLDTGHPQALLRQIVTDCVPALVLAADDTPELGVATLRMSAGDDGSPLQEPADVASDTAAYVIYTSGSTGAPRGVVVSRAALDNLVEGLDDLPLDAASRFAAVAATAFDAAIWEMCLAVSRAGSLHFCRPEHLWDDLSRHDVQVLTATPSLLAHLPAMPAALDVVISVGEPLSPSLLDQISLGASVINAYGPTETTICASFAAERLGDDVLSVGRAMRGLAIRILDEDLLPVPHGAAGEICVSGAGLALGYLNQDEITSERFPFLPDGTRVHRTGDIGRVDARGNLYFLGRRDDQVKVSGRRVFLSEIESLALETRGVTAAGAYVRRRAGRDADLGLALVTAEDADAIIVAVGRRCAERLPSGLEPHRIWRIDELPRTHNGKLDRRALVLAEPPEDARAAGRQPQDPIEHVVAEVWSNVLVRPVDDVECSLFDLGGQSLQAVRILSELRKRFGVRISVRDFLGAPTVSALAAALRAAGVVE